MDATTRRTVRRRCGDGCEYCRLPQAAAPFFTFHIEHIVATQHDGGDDLDNLALACPDCNRHKGLNLTSIDPLSREIVPLFHPRRDDWTEHFAIDGNEIVGQTSTGRATVRLLRFNDPERSAVRRVLLENGEWPPS